MIPSADRARQDRDYALDLIRQHTGAPYGSQVYTERDYTVPSAPAHVVANPTGGALTVVLPAAPAAGVRIAVSNVHQSNAITVASAALVDGAASVSHDALLSTVYVAVSVGPQVTWVRLWKGTTLPTTRTRVVQVNGSELYLAGIGGEPGRDVQTGGHDFSGTAVEINAGGCLIPADYSAGTGLAVYLTIRPTGGTPGVGKKARFTLYWKWTNDGAVAVGGLGTGYSSNTVDISIGAVTWTHTRAQIASISGTGKTASSYLEFRVERDGTHANDTYNNDCELLVVEVQYTADL